MKHCFFGWHLTIDVMFMWDNQASTYCGNIISLYKYDQLCIKQIYSIRVYIYTHHDIVYIPGPVQPL